MIETSAVVIQRNPSLHQSTINLPASKSESNRALIINSFSNGTLYNLSAARDTQTMLRLLKSKSKELDVLDAGTTMRFLVAYFALTNQNKILTGTPRMCERPIGILVDALENIGAEINYLDKDGYPPLETIGFQIQKASEISMKGDVSSQYISAIMMMSPMLPNGLKIHLLGKVASKPYIEMTQQLMQHFGAFVQYTRENQIIIEPSKYSDAKPGYQATEFAVESDWSGASYWFGFVALAKKASITLTGLKQDSLQGDYRIMEIMRQLGAESKFVNEGLLLTKSKAVTKLKYDFSNCPDLGQTVAVVCAAKGIPAELTGLESLRIKETDRISALQNELGKIGAQLEDIDGRLWRIHPANKNEQFDNVSIDTYDDHRMAMAFAPLATLMNLEIKDPSVVAKSYPSFWEDVEKVGFNVRSKE